MHRTVVKRADTAKNQTNAVVKWASLEKIVTNAIHIQAAKMEHVNVHGNVIASNVNEHEITKFVHMNINRSILSKI